MIIVCIFSTTKYHDRFNIQRKLHDFKDTNFKNSIDAQVISKKLFGLKWITPEFNKDLQKEIDMIIDTKNVLNKDKRKKIVFSNHSVLYKLLKDKNNSPGRWYAGDGSTHPIPNNKYYDKYKKILIKFNH